jgi:HK97 family phage major capsid protein
MDEEKDKLMNEILAKFNANIEEKTKSFLTDEDRVKIEKQFTDSITKFNEEGLKSFNEAIEKYDKELIELKEFNKEIQDIAKAQASEIDALKAPKVSEARTKLTRDEQLKLLIANGFKSKAFNDFAGTGYKGHSQKITIDNDDEGKVILVDATSQNKAVIPITDHTGTVMISEISDVVRDDTPSRKMHVRDLLNVSQTSSAQVVAGQVTGWSDALTLGATVLAENTAAPESVFTSEENTWGVKRIANSMRISKRWFKVNGLQWVIDYVLAKLPDATYTVEDFELLFGDGSGNHVTGLAKTAQAFDLTPNAYVATAFSSVATWNSGTQALVTFAAAHGMRNGDSLTIANAAAAAYNATHSAVEVVNATSVIIDVAYVVEADTSAWTGSSTNIFYHAIDNAQEYDSLAVTEALLEVDEFAVSGHVVNPQQKVQMGLLKATDDNYLNIQRDSAGRVVGVNGKPIVATSAMPAGKYISGDFTRNGAELKEFTPFNIQFVEDVTTAKANEIVVVVEEEIIFPIYNPYAFIYGKFSTAKAELETPSS